MIRLEKRLLGHIALQDMKEFGFYFNCKGKSHEDCKQEDMALQLYFSGGNDMTGCCMKNNWLRIGSGMQQGSSEETILAHQ